MNALLNQQRPLNPTLQAKLELLDNIQKGNYQRVRQLAYALSKVNNTNPELYGKISSFVHQHKQQLNDNDSSDNQQEEQPQIENIDDDFVEGKQWDSDDEVQYESQEQQKAHEEKNEKKIMTKSNSKLQLHRKELFKEVKNTMERKSVSSKKFSPAANNTYQFKSPVKIIPNKPSQLKPSSSKAQLHKNSAIGRTRNPLNH